MVMIVSKSVHVIKSVQSWDFSDEFKCPTYSILIQLELYVKK